MNKPKGGPITVETSQPPEGLQRSTPISDLPQPIRIEPTTEESLQSIRLLLEGNMKLMQQMVGILDAIRNEITGK